MLAAVRVLTALVLAGFAVFVIRDHFARFPQDAPWTPLDLTAPIGWATGGKLEALRGHPAQCRALLAAAGVSSAPVPPRADGPGCSLAGALRIDDPDVRFAPGGLALSCPLAAALTIWSRRVVAPAARARFGVGATAITDFGSYNCRRIAGTDRLSEHATANAIDVSGVRLADDRAVTITRDWHDNGPRGKFVRDLRAGACHLFGVVLSPDYNAAHHDHLHLDMGGGRVCG